MGVGGPRDALSFRGAEMAAETTTTSYARIFGPAREELPGQVLIHGPVGEVMSEDVMSDVFLPKSFTMVARDCRGTSLLFSGVFVALGNRIIPKDTNMLV